MKSLLMLPSSSRLAASAVVAAALAVAIPTASYAGHGTKTTTTTATSTASTAVAPVTSTAPVRLVSSTASVASVGGAVFAPDAGYAIGGSLVKTTHAINGTASPQLYQNARTGVSGYDIPVSAPGTYFVDLFVAETGGAVAGQRVWSLSGEGQTLVANEDVAKSVGQWNETHVLASVGVTDGVLNLRFTSSAGRPMIDAIEVDYQKAATTSGPLLTEDFNGTAGTAANSATWNYDTGGNGDELQNYQASTSNAALDGNGHLTITARQQTTTDALGKSYAYTSAKLDTLNKFSFQYGSAVARVQVPSGQGMWPAFWGEGTNLLNVGWPLSGEIDVMENLGKEPTIDHQTLHAGSSAGTPWALGQAVDTGTTLSGGYHDYGFTWGPTAITMQFDGRSYFGLSVYDLGVGYYWNFGHPFFLILNLAVGGWAGAPDATSVFPATMSVDYVHVTG